MRKNQVKIVVTRYEDPFLNNDSDHEVIIGAYADSNHLVLALIKAFVAIIEKGIHKCAVKRTNKYYKKIEEFYAESFSNEVYILCMNFGNEIQIFGAYTNQSKLRKSYNLLLEEDERCSLTEEFPQKPVIYRMPINQFIAWKGTGCTDNSYLFYDQVDNYQITIVDICD